jgi:hypothetical protein
VLLKEVERVLVAAEEALFALCPRMGTVKFDYRWLEIIRWCGKDLRGGLVGLAHQHVTHD